jgi:hypothetical protein
VHICAILLKNSEWATCKLGRTKSEWKGLRNVSVYLRHNLKTLVQLINEVSFFFIHVQLIFT